jgi:Ca-activated chloride channel family protein
MFQFAHPILFALLLPVALAGWAVYRRRVRGGVIFPSVARLPAAGRGWRARAAQALPALYLAGLVLIVGALARPRTVLSSSRRSANAIAIQMVADCSGSMNALDLSIRAPGGTRLRTRLDAVKETFAAFVEQRPDDLIGLITFGGYAATRVPLTADHAALLHVLQGVAIPRQVFVNGQVVNQEELLTAIGDALATACARLKPARKAVRGGADAEAGDPGVRSRIVVLLTDGESNTGIIKPEEATAAAKELGIKVYTIGVGTSGRAPFLAKDMFGRDQIQYADVTLDEKLLRRMAEQTGGRYFNATNPRGLEQALADIDKLEKSKVQRDVYEQYNELFPWLLFPALALVGAATTLNMFVAKRVI